jgi:hypothetical protein
LNPRPVDYESTALPLSYLGASIENSIRGKLLSIERKNQSSERASTRRRLAGIARYREKGYMAQPIPTPMRRNNIKDQIMYLTCSPVRRRLKNPKATEISNAKRTID